jgi:hypothetical protein
MTMSKVDTEGGDEIIWILDDTYVGNQAEWFQGQFEVRGRNEPDYEYRVRTHIKD